MKKVNKIIAAILGVSMATALFTGCKTKTEELSKTTIDSFNSIELNVNVAEIDFIPTTDEFAIEYHIVNQDVDYSVEDDVLTVKTKSIKSSVTFVTLNTDRSYIKIYVPEGSEFESLKYDGDVGGINIKDFSFDNVEITTDVGNVKLTDITVNNKLTVKTNVGNIDVKLTNPDCSYEISADVADIKINDSSYDGMDIKKSYTSDEGPEVVIKTDCGAIDFEY